VFVLLMGHIYEVQCLHDLWLHDIHTNFHDDPFKHSSNIVIISTISEVAVLVLLMGGIYKVCR
jgi:hypothetical protein